MASEIRANKSTNRAGLGTVTYADTGIIVSGIVTCTELSGLTALNISGVGTASTLDINGDIDVDGHTNLDNVSVTGISTFSGILDATNTPASIRVAQDIQHKGDADTKITFPTDNTISFDTAGSERLRITSGGEVKIADGGFLSVNTNPGASYGIAEALRIDDGASVYDRGLQFFEYSYSGARYHRIQFNLNTTTNGSAYTYTQGNYGGSSQIEFHNSGHLSFFTDAQDANGSTSSITPSERFRITSNGNIGAGGITSPLWTSGGGIHLNDNYGIGFGNGGSGRPDFQLMVTDGSKLEFRCGFGADTADIVMDTGGRLLVGTTTQSISSSELFEVKSSATGFSHFRNNSSSYAPIYIDNEYSDTGFAPLLTFTDGGGNRGGIGQDNNDLLRITGQGGFSVYTAGTHGGGNERFRIDGTTGDIMCYYYNSLFSQTGLRIYNNLSGGPQLAISRSAGNPMLLNRNTSDGEIVDLRRGWGAGGSIHVGTNSATYNTSSDYRLKENVVPISDAITRLKTLKPSRFNWIGDTNSTRDGFLAHEVTAVPEAITGTKDEVYLEDEPGRNIKAGDPKYQGIDQSRLVPLLTAALQEAIARIEALEG